MENMKGDSGTTPTFDFDGRPTPLGSRLQTDIDGDLEDVDNTQCVGLGYDSNIPQAQRESGGDDDNIPPTTNCVYFLPQLGFHISNGDTRSLERMTSLFLKGKVLRILCRILPRSYKKMLQKVYILHPTTKFRACFKVSKLFFEDKIANKVTFINSIAQLQTVLSPLAVKLPPALIQLEDASQPEYPQPLPPMQSLETLFDESLGAPPFVAKCLAYLREHAMQREGLFRVPGDQTVLTLCPRRFRDRDCANIIFVDTFHDLSLEDINPSSSSPPSAASSVSNEEEKDDGSRGRGGHGYGGGAGAGAAGAGAARTGPHTSATVVVEDVDVVAQLFKAYLRELPDAVITQQVYKEVVTRIRKCKDERRQAAAASAGSDDDLSSPRSTEGSEESVLGDAVEDVLLKHLPHSHWRTLQLILTFLADIAVQSHVNKMSPDNISVVFAPTLLQIDMSTPESAMESLPICQKIVRVLVLRKMEAHIAERMSPKFSFTRFE